MWTKEGLRSDDERLTLDFKLDYYLTFELDRDLLRQFSRSFAIKIWKKYPVKKFKPQIDEKKEPEFDIEHREEMAGFAVVSLQKLQENSDLTQLQEKRLLSQQFNL